MISSQPENALLASPAMCVIESLVRLSLKGKNNPPAEMKKWVEKTYGEKDWKKVIQLLEKSGDGQPLGKLVQGRPANNEMVLRTIREQVGKLPTPDENSTMEHLLGCLQDYILQKAKGASPVINGQNDGGMGFSIAWREKTYHFQLSCSPFWQWHQTDVPLATIGPLTNNGLMSVAHYFIKPPVRQNYAFFDPWSMQKINLVRGGIYPLVDWFFRDEYGIRFATPQSFSQMLMDYKILRYDIG